MEIRSAALVGWSSWAACRLSPTCSVHLHCAQLPRCQARNDGGSRNHSLLAGPVRGSQAAAAPVLVDSRTTEEDSSRLESTGTASAGSCSSFQQDDDCRLCTHVAVGGGVQGLAAAVGGHHACRGGAANGRECAIGSLAPGERGHALGCLRAPPLQPPRPPPSERKNESAPAAANMEDVSQFIGAFTPQLRALLGKWRWVVRRPKQNCPQEQHWRSTSNGSVSSGGS